MTLSDIARSLRLSWEPLQAVVKGAGKGLSAHRIPQVRQIAIDELYLGARENSSRWSWTWRALGSSGWGKAAGQRLCATWRRFKLSGAPLKAVAMDMSGAYACSVRAHAPHAILTFDCFHVMKLMNERLDEQRRELARETQTERPSQPLRSAIAAAASP